MTLHQSAIIAAPPFLKKRWVEAEFKMPEAQVQGRFILQRKHGDIILEERVIDNLILNQGLDALGGLFGNGWTDWVHIGTGTAAVVATQTGLASPVLRSNTVGNPAPAGVTPSAGNGWRASSFVRRRFNAGTLNGTFAEIGIGWANSNTTCFSRALISPTITVLPAEALDVLYEISTIIPTAAFGPSSVTITGVGTRNITTRAYKATASPNYWGMVGQGLAQTGLGGDMAAYTGLSGAIDSALPLGTQFVCTASIIGTYSSGAYSRGVRHSYGTAQGVGSLRTFSSSIIGSSGTGFFFQHELDVAITKLNTQTLTMDFNFSWTRA